MIIFCFGYGIAYLMKLSPLLIAFCSLYILIETYTVLTIILSKKANK